MAYSDYGAFVYKNGKRRNDKEDVPVWGADVELEVGSGARIFANLMKNRGKGSFEWWEHCHHGVIGDGEVRVGCYKQGFPCVYYLENGEVKSLEDEVIIALCGDECLEYVEEYDGKRYFSYDYNVKFEFMGRKFSFEGGSFSGKPGYFASMTEPDGTEWLCEYDYWYGAGFED